PSLWMVTNSVSPWPMPSPCVKVPEADPVLVASITLRSGSALITVESVVVCPPPAVEAAVMPPPETVAELTCGEGAPPETDTGTVIAGEELLAARASVRAQLWAGSARFGFPTGITTGVRLQDQPVPDIPMIVSPGGAASVTTTCPSVGPPAVEFGPTTLRTVSE